MMLKPTVVLVVPPSGGAAAASSGIESSSESTQIRGRTIVLLRTIDSAQWSKVKITSPPAILFRTTRTREASCPRSSESVLSGGMN